MFQIKELTYNTLRLKNIEITKTYL